MAAPQPDETELPQVVNLSQVRIESVQAELVRANLTIIGQLSAEEVDIQTSAAGTIQTGELHAQESLIGSVAAQQAAVQGSIVGDVRANSLTFDGVSALALANSMTARDMNSIVIAGKNLRADNIRSGLLFGSKVEGNVTTTVDERTALLSAIVGGSVIGLILLAGKLLFGRKD